MKTWQKDCQSSGAIIVEVHAGNSPGEIGQLTVCLSVRRLKVPLIVGAFSGWRGPTLKLESRTGRRLTNGSRPRRKRRRLEIRKAGAVQVVQPHDG